MLLNNETLRFVLRTLRMYMLGSELFLDFGKEVGNLLFGGLDLQ